ncbi:hypothetical protein CC86DRAFT_417666 [Ophiobolus disseminans]|uniref:Uncharacterized protein n=1 Tax=Ophiobolus disseminans TaxID=1469910 RepID=A0A6A7A031_9PLEO|nr:hypothetical protein CC86DRAFT_417666 [Ophiobolus disseminans]
MTVYYHYDDNGYLQSTSMDEPLVQGSHGHPDVSYYIERGNKFGAFFAQRNMAYPAHATSRAYSHATTNENPKWEQPSNAYSGLPDASIRHQSAEEEDDSYYSYSQGGRFSVCENTIGYLGFGAHSGQPTPYPNPEDIRHFHTLHSILPYLQPERKLNSLDGQLMDIVEQDTGTILAYLVSKKLLVLFLGRKMVTKYIRTLEREENEGSEGSKKCRGKPVVQVLSIPRDVGSRAAFSVLVSWMIRACQYQTMGQMRQFRVPQNTLVACTLAQVLNFFGLHKDALRVDHAISNEHFERPIFPVELEALWNCLGEENRYVYAAIKMVGQRLQVYEIGSTQQHPMWEEMVQLLKEYPPLNDRVRDLELNESHRPSFGTDWCNHLGGGSQPKTPTNGCKSNGTGDHARGGKAGSNGVQEQEMTLIQPDVPAKPTRKARVLRIVFKVGKTGPWSREGGPWNLLVICLVNLASWSLRLASVALRSLEATSQILACRSTPA